MKKTLIVGGVAGGASAAARLRRLDEKVEIILFERGEYISFANCGLPYYIGGTITEQENLTLQTPESFHARFRIDVRVFHDVVAIDREARVVTVLNHLTGEKYTESYDNLILSPGAKPIRPNIPGIDNPRVFVLRNIPDTFRIRDYINGQQVRHAAVVGAGYIGVEMAENLHAAGLDVTLIEMQDQVIAPLDYDMACDVQNHLREKGVNLILSNGVKAVEEKENCLEITLNQGRLQADILLLSIGVWPESDLARDAGLKVNERGCILVDEHMRTSDENIYAVGDVIEITDFVTGSKGYVPLAGPANRQGRIVADEICGYSRGYTGTQGSSILKVFDMTVATTGINEKTARRLGIPYEKSFTYSGDHASYYPDAAPMSIKTLFDPRTGKILGAQLVGYQGVDKRCDVFATVIRAGMTAIDLTELELCYAPPYSSAKDPVNVAGFVIQNILEHQVSVFHWHEVDTLPKDGSVTLLDVRDPEEFEAGNIEGFINIPLNELREHLSQLDVEKPVYVTCQIGYRGYLASRILCQSGFMVSNLSGGNQLYQAIKKNNSESSTVVCV